MKKKPKLHGTIMTPLNLMNSIRFMNTLLSEIYGANFVPPDRLVTKEEFYAQKQAEQKQAR